MESTGTADDPAVAASFALNDAALKNGVEYWNTLPHTDVAADLNALASELQSSGIATDTYVSDTGVRATLTDGSKFLFVFDTRAAATGLIDVEAATAAPAASSRHSSASTAHAQSAAGQTLLTEDDMFHAPSGSTKHEIVFLVNTIDDVVFDLVHTVAFANSFIKAGLPASAYQVDALAVDIDYIAALGDSHPIDYMNINTHGAVDCAADGTNCIYDWLTVTRPDMQSWTKYYSEIQTRTLLGGGALLRLRIAPDASFFDYHVSSFYWFTPAFLTKHTTFNSGAVVVNSSCSGQSPKIASAVTSVLAGAGVGLYGGWTGPARSMDADQSDAYLLDRLLGETSDNGLGDLGLEFMTKSPLILQRTPAQRAFKLTDVIAAMQTTERFPFPKYMDDKFPDQYPLPYAPGVHTLTQTTNAGSTSTLVFTTLNGGGAGSNLAIWGLPSIATMSTVESATGATLVVNGSFPASPGKGQIVDASGTYPLTPIAWSTTQIQFTLPPGGAGASGVVTVSSDEGVSSNPVPLTEWKGQLFVSVDDTSPIMNSSSGYEIPGVGSGTITTTTNLHFRADVHPVVTTIDTAPVPQNFVFSGMMGDSTTSLTSASARFDASDGTRSAQFSLAQPVATQTPVYSPDSLPAGTFIIGPYIGTDAPANCNNGLPGPQTSGAANVFCPFGGIRVADALSCSDTDGSLCLAPTYDYTGFYGYPPFVAANASYLSGYDGQLTFTLDPGTYQITFTSTPATLVEDYLFSTGESIRINLAATVQAPVNAPQ